MTPFEMLIPAGNAGSVSHETGGGVLRVMLAGSKAHNSFPDPKLGWLGMSVARK